MCGEKSTMDKKKKKEWIIKYIKKNNLEDILDSKYKGSGCNFIYKYTSEIQSICSIISVLIIGGFSLAMTWQYNNMVIKQTKIMEYGQKPLIDISINDNDGNNIDELTIVNNGIDALSYNVEVIPFFDVLCNENNLGHTPIRVFLAENIEEIEYLYNASKEIARIKLNNENCAEIKLLKNNLSEITHNYTTLFWNFRLTYLIIVNTTDLMKQDNKDYFLFDCDKIMRIENELGEDIVKEYCDIIWYDDGIGELKETRFNFKSVGADELFKYTLNKIRENGLYKFDFRNNEYVTYGDFEPE